MDELFTHKGKFETTLSRDFVTMDLMEHEPLAGVTAYWLLSMPPKYKLYIAEQVKKSTTALTCIDRVIWLLTRVHCFSRFHYAFNLSQLSYTKLIYHHWLLKWDSL